MSVPNESPVQQDVVPLCSVEHRLERGDIVTFAPCPFTLPTGDDRAFLMQQRLHGSTHKNISYNPRQRQRIRPRSTFAGAVAASGPSAAGLFPSCLRLAVGMSPPLCTCLAARPRHLALRGGSHAQAAPDRNATTSCTSNAFPSRPTRGHRILRLYVNINPTDDRVWATSDTFAKVIEKYGDRVGSPAQRSATWAWRLGQGFLSLFQPSAPGRTEYDEFMLRLHHFP